jgi:hypothetical protein
VLLGARAIEFSHTKGLLRTRHLQERHRGREDVNAPRKRGASVVHWRELEV